MKGHTLEQRLMTDFCFCLMTDRADNIVTKRGRSKKILLHETAVPVSTGAFSKQSRVGNKNILLASFLKCVLSLSGGIFSSDVRCAYVGF